MSVSEGVLVVLSAALFNLGDMPRYSILSHCVLAAAVSLLGTSYMHYILAPGQPAPGELLAFMQQQGSRRSRSSSLIRNKQGQAGAGDSALFSFTKSMAFMPRIVVNAQVGVTGDGCHNAFQGTPHDFSGLHRRQNLAVHYTQQRLVGWQMITV